MITAEREADFRRHIERERANRARQAVATTVRQDRILAFVRTFLRDNGYPPTIREIGAAMDIKSPNGVMCHLRALAKKGLVRSAGNGQSRGWLPVVPEGCCPCCGRAMEPEGEAP